MARQAPLTRWPVTLAGGGLSALSAGPRWVREGNTMTKKLVCKVDDDMVGGCNYLVLDLTANEIEYMKQKREECRESARKDPRINYVEVDSPFEVYGGFDDSPFSDEDDDVHSVIVDEEELLGAETNRLPGPCSTSLEQMVVSKKVFWFTFYQKHSDKEFETNMIVWDDFDAMLAKHGM
jgi:hypothetical protein